MSTLKATKLTGITKLTIVSTAIVGPVFPTDFTKITGNDVVMEGTQATFSSETSYCSNINTSNDFEISGTFLSGANILLGIRASIDGTYLGNIISFSGFDLYYGGWDGGNWEGSMDMGFQLTNGDTYSYSNVGNVATVKVNGNTIKTFTPHYSTGAYCNFYVGGNSVHSDLIFKQL